MIDIKEVIWTNFLGYGDYKNSISFDNLQGACLIEGEIDGNEDRDEGDEKLNGAGKSSIIEAIAWGLFGNLTNLENPGDKVIHWQTGKNCRVSIKTNDGYEIVRMRKYNGLTETIVMKDGEDATKSTSKTVQSFINDTFKIDYHTFIRSSIFGQKSSGFLELGDTKIRKVMESLMGVGDLSPIVKTAKNKSDAIDKEISIIDADITRITNEIDRIQNHISNLESKSLSFDDEISSEITEIKSELSFTKKDAESKIQDLSQQVDRKNIEKDNQELYDLESIEHEWEQYNKDLSEFENKLSEQSDIKEKISDLKSLVKINENSLESIIIGDYIDISDLEKQIVKRKNTIEKTHKFKELKRKLSSIITEAETKRGIEQKFIDGSGNLGSTCTKCRNPINGEELKEAIKDSINKIEKYNEDINQANDKLSKVDGAILSLEESLQPKIMTVAEAKSHNNEIEKSISKRDKIEKETNDTKSKLNDLEKSVGDLLEPQVPSITKSEARATNNYLINIDKAIEDLNKRISETKKSFKKSIDKANEAIKKVKAKDNPYTSLINEQHKQVRDLEEEKTNFAAEKSKKRALKEHIDYIKESYRNKKKIKAFWIGELIPEFNRYLRYYLDYFEVDDRVEFDEFLSIKMDRWGYITHSGGECKRIDLSIMFALNDLHTANFGSQSNFMVLDEVDGKIDPFTMNKLVTLISDDLINRQNGPSNVFMISHRKEMKDRLPHKIKVKNKQGRSYIVNDG